MTARMDDGRRVGHRPDCRALRCRRRSRSPGTSDHCLDRLFLEVVIECASQAIQSRTDKWQFGVLLVSLHRSVVRRVSIPATRRSFVCETAMQELAHHLSPSSTMLVVLVEVAVAVVGTPSLSTISWFRGLNALPFICIATDSPARRNAGKQTLYTLLHSAADPMLFLLIRMTLRLLMRLLEIPSQAAR